MENKQMIADSILENVRTQILEFIDLEPNIQCPIEYEKKVLSIAMSFSRNLILGTQGQMPKSRNVKKNIDHIW
jgi:hypothetical protein